MGYSGRVLWQTVRVLIWPDHWSLRIWRWPASAGFAAAPVVSGMVNAVLHHFGYCPWPLWYYFIGAGVLAIVGLAYRVAILTITKISIGKFLLVKDDDWYCVKIPVRNSGPGVILVRCSMRISQNGAPQVHGGADEFSPMTTKRLQAYRQGKRDRSCFNIDKVQKCVEIFQVSRDLSQIHVYEELFDFDIDPGDYTFDILVTGDTPTARTSLSLHLASGQMTISQDNPHHTMTLPEPN